MLMGCIERPNISVGGVYTIAGKPGSHFACFPNLATLREYAAIDHAGTSIFVVEGFATGRGFWLHPGDRVRVLDAFRDEDELKIKVLSSGSDCYIMNAGGGLEGTLFDS